VYFLPQFHFLQPDPQTSPFRLGLELLGSQIMSFSWPYHVWHPIFGHNHTLVIVTKMCLLNMIFFYKCWLCHPDLHVMQWPCPCPLCQDHHIVCPIGLIWLLTQHFGQVLDHSIVYYLKASSKTTETPYRILDKSIASACSSPNWCKSATIFTYSPYCIELDHIFTSSHLQCLCMDW